MRSSCRSSLGRTAAGPGQALDPFSLPPNPAKIGPQSAPGNAVYHPTTRVLTVLELLQARGRLQPAAPAVEGALAKLNRVLPAVVGEQVQALQESLTFDVPPVEASPTAATVRTFGSATSQRRRLQLAYRSWDGTSTERTVDPYGLVY